VHHKVNILTVVTEFIFNVTVVRVINTHDSLCSLYTNYIYNVYLLTKSFSWPK